LGHPELDTGLTLFGDVSPDGKTVVVNHLDAAANGSILNSQLFLIDLASGHAKPVGKPMDTAFVNWTADGQHLVLVIRKTKDLNSVPDSLLATMDMDGHVTELRPGDTPALLADRQTILFEDRDTKLWNTCDLQGQNVKLFADGLKGYGFPAPAPDGKRILMMHFSPGALPEPVLLNIGESAGRVITQVGGLWGEPAWR
jgi:Tol biopolymer transport system component